jgi:hypothetical protein
MKKLFLLFVFLISCTESNESNVPKNHWVGRLPKGAVIYKTNTNTYSDWVFWKFDGECFLSGTYDRNLTTAKITCK